MSTHLPTSDSEIKYSFLRVRKEKESIILGISPTGKTQQEILNTAKNLSTVQNAGKGALLSLKKNILDQLQLDEKTLSQNLFQLVNNQFLCQIPVFEYEPSDTSLEIVPYFITHPGDDKNFFIFNLFEELIVASFKSLKYWYEAKPKVSREDQMTEYTLDLKGVEDRFKGNSNIFNCIRVFKEFKNGIPIYDEVLTYTSAELERRFVEMNFATELKGHGIIFIKPSELQDIFEIADEFMMLQIIHPLLNDPIHRAQLDPIILEKKIYYETNDFPFKTTKYSVELAKYANDILSKNRGGNSLIVLDVLIQLDSYVDAAYTELWRSDCDRVKKEFKKSIAIPSSKWSNLITFIQNTESLRYPPEVWKDLLTDFELYYIKWQSPKGTIHVFTSREHSYIKSLVIGMITIHQSEHWKAVALKYLIDKNEKTLRTLLLDKNFSVVYQELNKVVYKPYIPWYFRILMFIPIQSLIEKFYELARQKIKEEQDYFSSKNDDIARKLMQEIETKKNDEVEHIRGTFFTDTVKRSLDDFYLTKKKVPTVQDLMDLYPDDLSFLEKVRKYKFRILSLPIRGGENISVVMYPDDEDWQSKKNFLIDSLENVVADRNPHISTSVDMVSIEKAQNLLDILNQEVK
jgi:hypothetical protein